MFENCSVLCFVILIGLVLLLSCMYIMRKKDPADTNTKKIEKFTPLSSTLDVESISPVRDQGYFARTNSLMSSFGAQDLTASSDYGDYTGIV